MILIPIILIAIAAYFIYDMVLLIREKELSVARSRTFAILLGLFMRGWMLYGYITETQIFF